MCGGLVPMPGRLALLCCLAAAAVTSSAARWGKLHWRGGQVARWRLEEQLAQQQRLPAVAACYLPSSAACAVRSRSSRSAGMVRMLSAAWPVHLQRGGRCRAGLLSTCLSKRTSRPTDVCHPRVQVNACGQNLLRCAWHGWLWMRVQRPAWNAAFMHTQVAFPQHM